MKHNLLFVIFILFLSCVKQEESEESLNITLTKHSVNISDKYLQNYIPSTLIAHNGKARYVGYNRFSHSIDIIDLFDTIRTKIMLAEDGPDAIEYPVNKLQASKEGIVIVKNPPLRIFQLDFNGKIINLVSEENLPKRYFEFNKLQYQGVSFANYELISMDNLGSLIKETYPIKKADEEFFYDDIKIATVNLKNPSRSKVVDFDFPESIKKVNGIDYDFPSVTIGKDNTKIISFPSSNVILTDRNGNFELLQLEASTDVIDSDQIEIGESQFSRRSKTHRKGNRLFPLKYDKFHNMYYRIWRSDYSESRLRKHNILFYDLNFNLVGSTILPNYLTHEVFPTQKGLLFLHSNESYKSETNIDYTLLSIK